MADRTTELLDRFKKAVSRKDMWVNLYRDAQEYAAPQRETFDESTRGEDKNGSQVVFDSTAQESIMTGVSNLHSSLTPPMKRWIELKAGASIDSTPELDKALSKITDVMFSHIHSSNFDTQIVESYHDLFFGTGALLVFEGDKINPFNFVNVPLSQLYLEEGPHGRIDTAFRKFKLSGRNIKKQWADADITKEIQDIIDSKPDDQLDFIEATVPDKVEIFDRRMNGGDGGKKLVDGYRYFVIHEKTKEVIVERAMRHSPWIIFRWANLPSEIYGRGPVLTALPAIKTLNEQVKILLEAASIATLGMYTAADDGIVNLENIKLGAGALIPVTSNGSSVQGPTLQPLATAGNPNLAQLIIEKQQEQIRRMLFGSPLGDVNLPVKTATEMSLRQQELANRMGSSFGKLQYELIGPLVDVLLGILDNLGLIDLGDFRIAGGQIAIEHISPLAQSQDEEDILRNIRFVQTLGELFGPEVAMAIVDPFAFGRDLGEKLNISKNIIASKDKEEAIKSALAQQAAQGQQLQG